MMGNMSYCRFQNTAADFADCADNWYSIDPSDPSDNARRERESRKKLIEQAARLLCEMGIADIDENDVIGCVNALDTDHEEFEFQSERNC